MATIEDKVFDRLFKEAEIATFTPEELREYEDSLKAYRDIKNSIDSARREGRAEGLAEGLAEGKKDIARKMNSKGFSAADISEMTGLTDEEIETQRYVTCFIQKGIRTGSQLLTLPTFGVHFSTLVHSLGSMNLPPMILNKLNY